MNKKIFALLLAILFVVDVNAQNVLKVQAGATLSVTGGAVITLQNTSLDNDGTIALAPGDGTFAFTGTAANTLSGTAMPVFDILQINKTGAGSLTLNRNINVAGSINFTAGNINLNSNNILLQPNALLTGESESSRITGITGGYVEITNILNAPASVNPGNLGAMITSAANLGSTVIRRGQLAHVIAGPGTSSINRYFDIMPTNNAALDASLRFFYFDAELNGQAENLLTLWKSSDNTNWTNEGFTDRNETLNYVGQPGINDFSRWTLAAPGGGALPVQFLLFNTQCNTNRVDINWKTATEQNSSHFDVQRSDNSSNWVTIGKVQAAGNSNGERSYSFTDSKPLPGTAFYRIAEVDIDSRVHYTSIIKNECGQIDTWKVWPNPVQDQLFVNINAVNSTRAVIRIYDNKGALVREQNNTLLAGNNQFHIDFNRLAAGMYHVIAVWDNGKNKKVIKVIRE